MDVPSICRYCGGVIRLVPAEVIYGEAAAERLDLVGEFIYRCQNCNARVGCHKGTTRPLGNVANESLRLKRIETHQIFDRYWKRQGMTRTEAYRWLSKQLHLSERKTHIGSFEMDLCQRVIDLCQTTNKEAA